MGRLDKGLLGGYTGKLGTTVGSTWKGINVVRTYQPNVANPRSDKQVEHRSLFSQVTEIGSLLLADVIKPLWDRNAKQMSGYNAFIQANMLAASKTTKLSPERFVLANGRIGNCNPSYTMTESTFLVKWDKDSLPVFGKATDKAYVIVFDGSMNILDYHAGSWPRDMGAVQFPHDGSLEGNAESAVIAFLSEDGKLSSNTEWVKIDYRNG